ncbi:sensor histidine kinase [Acinetobacter bereziniae]|uniref:sensor histidine kinase n=1 Tax=Acinetobacter bereziniae TaxID=106648 RepID=UPI001902322A|nr:sensor histidine kinase [Acinetobacter bereziniae]MBJ8443131.1 ATP-binding protein [Acinetobacter bereziniae]
MTNETSENQKEKFEFKPRARLLAQLGDQLIKNEHIAVVELIKNAYDADATFCKIELDNFMDRENGSITILDNGNGMDIDIVKNAWLEPGSDSKLDEDKKPKLSPVYQRLPIGEKGIGRFGVHKLGDKITLITKKQGSKEVHVEIDWSDIEDVKYLKDFPIKVEEKEEPLFFTEENLRDILNLDEEFPSDQIKLHGTFIFIKTLKTRWDHTMVKELARTVSSLQSPFQKTNQEFKVDLILNQNKEWLDGVQAWDDIRKQALFKFKVKIKGSEITSFNYWFMPYESIQHKINKKHLTLENNSYLNSYRNLYDEESKQYINLSESSAKVGEVTFEGYIFELETSVLRLGSIEHIPAFKKYLKTHTGVKVFRDGLRVYDYGEPENDWLGLDNRRFNNPTKGLSNSLVVAAVQLDRANSSDLFEKTNREGFVENDAYLNLKKALNHVLTLVENLRYADKLNLKRSLDTGKKQTPNQVILEAIDYVEEQEIDVKVKKEIITYFDKLDKDLESVKETLLNAAGIGLSLAVVVHEVEKRVRLVNRIAEQQHVSEELLDNVQKLSKIVDRYVKIIKASPLKLQSINFALDELKLDIEFRQDEHRIEVIYNYEDTADIKVEYSRSLVSMVLINIIDNSIYWLDQKYDVNGFEGAKKIFINVEEDDKYGYVVIADNGPGFNEICMDTITEPFVSYKPRNSGMGLGLHIAQEAMFKQKGDILFPDYTEFDIPDEFHCGALVVLRFNKEKVLN